MTVCKSALVQYDAGRCESTVEPPISIPARILNRWHALSMQVKLALLIQGVIAIMLFFALQWLVSRAEHQILFETNQRALVTADGVINGMNMLMETGTVSDAANRTLLIRKMAQSNDIVSLRIVRAKQVSDQFGPGLPEEQPADPIEKEVLKSGKIYTQQVNGKSMLRVVVPFIASHNFRGTDCLRCHHVANGSVNGAASMLIDLSGAEERIHLAKIRLWTGQILLQATLFFIIWNLVRSFIRPVKALQETMTEMQADGDLSRRVKVEGASETAKMAAAFNSLVSNLQSSNAERDRIEQALRSAESRARALLENLGVGVIVMDENGIIEACNPAADEIFGHSPNEIIGRNVRMLIPESDRDRHDAALKRYRETGKPLTLESGESAIIGVTTEMNALRKDGSTFPIAIKVTEVNIEERRLFLASVRDISARKRNEEDLRIAATAFETREGILITDLNHVILKVNRTFTQLTGYSMEEAVGRTPAMLKSGRHDEAFHADMWEVIHRDKYWQGEVWSRRKNGEIYPISLTTTAVTDADDRVTHYVSVFSDITLRRKSEEEIHRLAFYDPLTGLPNRSLLQDRLQQALNNSARRRKYGALLFIDLDNFKILNDTKGHNIGDLLLMEAARRLQGCVRDTDTVARLGGDEFVVMLEEMDEDGAKAAAASREIAEKLLVLMRQPFTLQEFEYHSSCSIGISLFLGNATSMDDLFKHADNAMYQAKTQGRNTICFFDPGMQAELVIRTAMAEDLRMALPNNQFRLYYQIQVNGRDAMGAEALLRWQHPLRGLVSPVKFIPVAEESGLIVQIGEWVLKSACLQLRAWQGNPLTHHLQIAVNVSARQFRQPDFVSRVISIFEETGANPLKLKMELTESLMLENVASCIEKMQALRAIGVRFSVDDFGTGHSSLSYLKRLPLQQIKIDQGFVRDITTDPSDAAIVQTIIGMARNLGLDVIAEGVETEEQRAFLEQHGCDDYQGYLFSRPVPLEAFEDLLASMDKGYSESAPS